MSTDDMIYYTIAWVVSYMCLIGGFYIAAHIWADRKVKKYLDEVSSSRHEETE